MTTGVAKPRAVIIEAAEVDPRAQPTSITATDGTRLATDVYLPANTPGPVHTILIRLPYDKCGRYAFLPSIANYLCAHGFGVVVQDVRGKFRSEGRREPFVNEAADGHATLDWIQAQTWSSGAVGMLGDSYYGFTQWAAASTGHPALRAIVPRVTGTGLPAMFSPDVVPRIPIYEWILQTFAIKGMYDYRAAVRDGEPTFTIPEDVGHVRKMLTDLMGGAADGSLVERSYQGRSPASVLDIPALHMGGWWTTCSGFSWPTGPTP